MKSGFENSNFSLRIATIIILQDSVYTSSTGNLTILCVLLLKEHCDILYLSPTEQTPIKQATYVGGVIATAFVMISIMSNTQMNNGFPALETLSNISLNK